MESILEDTQKLQAEARDAQDELARAAREARQATQKLQDAAAVYMRVHDRLHTSLCDALTEASEALVFADPSLAAKLGERIAELQKLVASRVRLEHIVDLKPRAEGE
jgi:hypothetical protein